MTDDPHYPILTHLERARQMSIIADMSRLHDFGGYTVVIPHHRIAAANQWCRSNLGLPGTTWDTGLHGSTLGLYRIHGKRNAALFKLLFT